MKHMNMTEDQVQHQVYKKTIYLVNIDQVQASAKTMWGGIGFRTLSFTQRNIF